MACLCCKREKEIKARGLCGACYQRWRSTGSTEYQRKGVIHICHIKNCGVKIKSHGLCSKHLSRLQRHGNTDKPIRVGRKIIGNVKSHPMYGSWDHIRRFRSVDAVSQEWLDDFYQFVMDVGERPTSKHKLFRADDSKPYGKNNFVWKKSVTHRVRGEDERTFNNRRARVYRALRKEAYRDQDLKKNYGLSEAQYNEILKEQNGVCEICSQPEKALNPKTKEPRRLAVDHCHETGEIRGLLCTNCNHILGSAKDSIDTLYSAIAYLKKPRRLKLVKN